MARTETPALLLSRRGARPIWAVYTKAQTPQYRLHRAKADSFVRATGTPARSAARGLRPTAQKKRPQ